ncbi:CelD/BcsL family acetyltransferase involved in cellulose biosynthesis [Sphingomonas sp. BE270]|uniref:GNAT family N-acetyltransferase n=1 Tax=unclassified Sphingomonas TaxID=196159 RepID=UPI000B3240EA|nr:MULTISPECIES: GNAT family N-acetyltransferase [unclassified Sphingomonas]MDR6847431.1 CelD/BcsL family acetyltransferase involved in cellulose biosynthesis [Sphingomonas sp. BE137]MDR7256975.1 CelD/BcsL family acetyltransferase involved in cellulose biosynthesis [Sphingomonas sp. BE270]
MNGAEPLPLRFQIGARTLAAVERYLVRVPLSLGQVLDGQPPVLPPLAAQAHGYLITSVPAAQCDVVMAAAPGMIAQVRQRYTRHYADLGIGFDAYQAALSGNTRSGLKRKTRRVMEVSGGLLDVRRFRTPEEMQRFHDIARGISRRTYQERLLGGGLPDDAPFLQSLRALAAADSVRAWLLYIAGEPAAYLYCPVVAGTVRYDHVGHDPAFNDLSPGGVLMLEAMRDLYAEPGLTQFDFTEGDGQHKRSFATDGVACLDLLLLRPSLANRATMLALGVFDRSAAWGKRAVARLGLEALAKRVRR